MTGTNPLQHNPSVYPMVHYTHSAPLSGMMQRVCATQGIHLLMNVITVATIGATLAISPAHHTAATHQARWGSVHLDLSLAVVRVVG